MEKKQNSFNIAFRYAYNNNLNNRDSKINTYLTKVPINELDLKIIVVNLFAKELLTLPIDSLHIYRIIKKKFRHYENSVFLLSRLDINSVINSLIDEGCFIYEEMMITYRKSYYIKSVDMNKLNQVHNQLQGINISEPLDDEKMRQVIMHCLNTQKNDNLLKARLLKDPKILSLSKKDEVFTLNIYKDKLNIELLLGSNKRENIELAEEDHNFMNSIFFQPSAKMLLNQEDTTDNFNKKYKTNLNPFCPHGTRSDCIKKKKNNKCDLIHFQPIIKPHTDVSQGDCSYLDTCRHMDICKFVHYEIEDKDSFSNRKELILSSKDGGLPSQWINCDIRFFDLSVLGKFDVIMADPPWDIHMDLPYGTLTDEEMKAIKIQSLQDHGVIFLWVTGRATELARECLDIWGYERAEELVWIKTNQLQRLIRTGRTGHWLNHSKEHCLIGIKGNPKLNKNVDCDVIVSEVRETSRKPDEIYELIDRLSPGGRKIELFARPHNRRHGWVSLGNQLPGAYFVEDDVINRFNATYPKEKLSKEDMEMNRIKSIETKTIQS